MTLSHAVWFATMSMITFICRRWGLLYKPSQVVLGSQCRIDRVVVANSVRAAQRALFFEFSVWVNGHEPEDAYSEAVQVIQAAGHAIQVSLLRERACKYLVDHAGFEPCWRRPGSLRSDRWVGLLGKQ